ncbi:MULTISPECIES: diaminobutyrate--2-oxoglutarate transaminase [unclassified Pseudoalteromonas]|uniref:diaminobutyrate--2-oxoglutarate transaminase n=1 Tax=unclassified Pseudoalteromonas TaxID=194690 RepID=UPI001F3772D9|nr:MULTISPECIES: diaminobutyrate--2-oxoglutarate transaminase [unclassified Pseudoalteromonas]MCF2825925.1 diaminobutyrate--2-oxoglutarate transaminase [Pseudoalteromonas sp. OF5H-5]MCF2829947.1 diaminobutyrate--2-oxoglutarate transaminase [Pseudoalteromonas sp. DL2-H6]MCF2925416.1 diaminobutyrate--2-oxoglutarate transaminase [Pseudoalteromonas sp. DL2-H1]
MNFIFEQYESSARSYCRQFSVVFKQAKGSTLVDNEGRSYIDFLSGAGALNYGHNNAAIKNEVVNYLESDGILMGLDLYSQAKMEFIDSFVKHILQPRTLNYRLQFTSPTGTSVVESAIKLARKYTQRENIICFTNAFHGMTGMSLNLTGNDHHRQSGVYSQVTRLPFEGYAGDTFDSIGYFRKLLTDPSSGVDMPAAIILETVQGEGGLNVASIEWLKALRELTRELNILLIVDDIQAGCGRTGEFFSFERADIKPDMVCLSKSIGGIGLPMALLLIEPKVDIWKPAEDNGTFRGNNLAFVAAKAMIEHYWSTPEFGLEIAEKANIISETLHRLTEEYAGKVIQVKGLGLMQGMEMNDASMSQFIVENCFEQGLILERCGPENEIVKLMPALTIPVEQLQKGLTILKRAFKHLENNMQPQVHADEQAV